MGIKASEISELIKERGVSAFADTCPNQPRSEVVLSGQTGFDQLDWQSRQDRHSIPALLAICYRVVAERFELLVRKKFVRHLQFLKPDDVGLSFL